MTSRERLLKTLRRQPVDRVPVPARMWKFLRKHYRDVPDLLEREIMAQNEFGNDIWFYTKSPPLPCHAPLGEPWRDDIEVELKEWIQDGKQYHERTIHTPKGDLHDVKRRMIITEGAGSGPEVVEPVLKDLSRDLPLLPYMHPEPSRYSATPVLEAQERLGDRGITFANMYSPIDCRSDVMKQEDFLMLYYDDPGAFREIVGIGAETMMGETAVALEAGVEVVKTWWFYTSPSAGWSPRIFEEMFLPHLVRHVEQVHRAGGIYVYYDDGKLMQFMDLYVSAGVDCVMTCCPPPMGDADPAILKERYGDKVCIMGGVDAVNEIYLGDPASIREMVSDRLEIMKPGGGYILDGSNSLVWETPAENVKAFVEAGIEFGSY